MKIQGYAVHAPGAPVEVLDLERNLLGPLEVDVRVSHCGVCHTDVGMVDDEFGISQFPVVAGHEAVGVVAGVDPPFRQINSS